VPVTQYNITRPKAVLLQKGICYSVRAGWHLLRDLIGSLLIGGCG